MLSLAIIGFFHCICVSAVVLGLKLKKRSCPMGRLATSKAEIKFHTTGAIFTCLNPVIPGEFKSSTYSWTVLKWFVTNLYIYKYSTTIDYVSSKVV